MPASSRSLTLPATAPEERWETLLDTADPWPRPPRRAGGNTTPAAGSTAVSLNCRKEDLRRVEDWGPMGVY
jgi:hypothetical protein